MKQIERLMEYFPIQRDTMIACLAKPISAEFAAELRNMDIRLEGMSNPKLKEVIKNYLHLHAVSTNHTDPPPMIAPTRATIQTDDPTLRHLYAMISHFTQPLRIQHLGPKHLLIPIKTPVRPPNLFLNSQPTLHTPT